MTGVADKSARAGHEPSQQAVSAVPVTIANAEIVKPPHHKPLVRDSVFLAGSIDMGKAVNWQQQVTAALMHLPIMILNPRRDDWDASWAQDISNPQFREQVEWELNHLDACTVIAMYFDPAGPAPISLLELGLYARTGKLIVCCSEGYWRRGNVQIVCARYGIRLVDTVGELVGAVAEAICPCSPTLAPLFHQGVLNDER